MTVSTPLLPPAVSTQSYGRARLAAEARRSTRGRLTLTALVVSAFGPYLYSGVRTEQITVYGLAIVLLPSMWPRLRPSRSLGVALAGWGALTVVAVIGWLQPPPVLLRYWPGSPLANVDNLVLPVAVVLVTLAMVALGGDRVVLLRRVAQLVVAAMVANAAIALVQTQVAIDSYLSGWWSSGTDSVAARAITLGRYTGVLNQPALAGVMYGIAAMCALYLLHEWTGWLLLVNAVLVIGGTLAISKAFFLVGLPVVAWHMFRMGDKRGQRVVLVGGAAAAVYGLALGGWLSAWPQVDRVLRLVPTPDTALLSLYTGGRYGEESVVGPVIDAVMGSAPVAGLGLAGVSTATDSAWLEVLVLAGVLGVAAFAVVLIAVVASYLGRRASVDEPERRLFAGVATILVLSSFAFPVLTGNRLAVVVWVLLTLLMLAPVREQRRLAPPKSGPGLQSVGTAGFEPTTP